MINAPRYNINSYLDWIAGEGLRVSSGLSLNLFDVDTEDWPRYGLKGAVCHFDGSGDYCNMFVLEMPAGGASLPQRHLYEEIFYVLEGRGSTEIELGGAVKRSFEWSAGSFFGIPLNAEYRLFNASGTKRALLATTTTLPMMINIFHNEGAIFDCPMTFAERNGKDAHYEGGGDLQMIRPGNHIWETNFVPDLNAIELPAWEDRGSGSLNINIVMADGIMHAHVSEVAAATYKKAHRHPAGTHVLTLTGSGYSLLWDEGNSDFTRIEWSHGVVFPPCENQFHQHFVTSNSPSRYVATGLGSQRYPLTAAKRKRSLGSATAKQLLSKSVKEGGSQIEYEDQDPRIHALWLEEMQRHGIAPKFTLPVR